MTVIAPTNFTITFLLVAARARGTAVITASVPDETNVLNCLRAAFLRLEALHWTRHQRRKILRELSYAPYY